MRARLIVVLLLVIFTASLLALHPAEEGGPGAWIPSPVGSGWCTAHAIPRIPEGLRAHCPRPQKG